MLKIYFLGCSFLAILLYLYKRLQYFYDASIFAFLGFSISFLFLNYTYLYEIENILFIVKDMINFIGNPESLSVVYKIMLGNFYLSYPENELQLLLNKDGFGDAPILLTNLKPIEDSANFAATYAFVIY